MAKLPQPTAELCPCNSGQPFASCCAPYLAGDEAAPTAVALMRSRYCAYVRRDAAYLLRTWHPSTRPAALDLEQNDKLRWLGLKILNRSAGGPEDREGTVEFAARYKAGGKAGRMHEISRFVREEGAWYYLDGKIR